MNKSRLIAFLSAIVLLLLMSNSGLAQSPGDAVASKEHLRRDSPEPEVSFATRTDATLPLRELPPIATISSEMRELPRKMLPNRIGSVPGPELDPSVQGGAGQTDMPSSSVNFEGVGNVNAVLPPDTIGDVGPNHYVQMVNLSFAIWDKSGNQLLTPRNINTLWQGFGGPCESTNDGDPVVLYDHLADRWLMSQFALPNFPFGPFYECIAISQTPDPTDAWYRFAFKISNTKLNDYPKFGVWPDGYYMAVNQFNQGTLSWGGQGVVVFERDKMLVGQLPRMVYFDLFSTDPNLGGMLPSDLDGPLPPTGAPNYFTLMDDDAWGYSPDQLQVWEFLVSWANPRASSFTLASLLETSPFDSNLCNYDRNCIPQPGGTNLDAISDRLMYRLQYRNFGTHEAMVVNHTVDASGADRAGIRWYELRMVDGDWAIYQQGTYSIDSAHRWMGSIAMDGDGNIALGYSVSSTSISPSIRYAGRLVGDPLGTLLQAEATLITGSGFQQHTSGRWGDYSMMAVDPTDGCTYWYTQEYYNSISLANWQTRIGSFGFPECGGAPVPSPTPTSTLTPTPTPIIGPSATPTVGPTFTPGPRPTSTASASKTPVHRHTSTPGP